MNKNGYFQLVHKSNQLWIKIIPPVEEGEMFELEELIHYLDMCKISDYNLVELSAYYNSRAYGEEFKISEKPGYPENEKMELKILPQGLQAIARFYSPSTQGGMITREEIESTLRLKGVIHGVQNDAISQFLNTREYCKDFIVAVATPPIHGKDAEITYHFDTSISSKPKMNEDGSVDFHDLGNIKPVKPGDVLATLTPADLGTPGTNVLGNAIRPRRVKNMHLRFGQKIELSEDKQSIHSLVAGHVTLVDDLVMVSDVYEVPKSVDVSTGDIKYSGTVEINGNVLTGFKVETDGDIIVNGVVEGASLIAGGNIVLKSGMQGGSKGLLKAKGNIVAKYLENTTVECEGGITCEAMMHCQVTCQKEVHVTGKRGLITGGYVASYCSIYASNLGSNMGTDTTVEILQDIEIAKKCNELENKVKEIKENLDKMEQIIRGCSSFVKSGKKLTKEQENQLKVAAINRGKLQQAYEITQAEVDHLNNKLDDHKDTFIEVDGKVFSGVKIVIRDMKKIMRESISNCKFTREGADIKMSAL